MNNIKKRGIIKALMPSEEDMAAINAIGLRTMSPEEVYTFRLAACDNQVDRDWERFADAALEELARLYPGKPVLLDHSWSATAQTGRVYGADVEEHATILGGRRLILRCYVPRLDSTQGAIDALETGLWKECSVCCAMAIGRCSICGNKYAENDCLHIKGREYDGQRCCVVLENAVDAYEVSLVAVPAQPGAGVVKTKDTQGEDWAKAARMRLPLEQVRYGAPRH